ncbi:MAG TPA: hypothetical protein VF168_04535 [Trueperaceae bacterium]
MTPGRRLLVTLLLTLLAAGTALATTYRELSLAEILERAEVAFFGTVASVTVEERLGEPWTIVEFAVERQLAAEGEAARRELAFLGGELAGEALRVSLMPAFEVGEEVLVLAYDEPYISPIVGFDQGLWRVDDGELRDARGRRLSVDEDGRLVADGPRVEIDLILGAIEAELEDRP